MSHTCLLVADALSRAPTSSTTISDNEFRQEVNMFVNLVMKNLPASEKCLIENMKLQEEDEVCKQIKQYSLKGWPDRSQLKGAIKPYLPVSAELTVQDGLLMRGSRIVIPPPLRLEMLDRLHTGH